MAGPVDVIGLSAHPEHRDAARSLLREFFLLPDVWARFGEVPARLPDALERELTELPGLACPPHGEVVLAMAEVDVVAAGHLVPWDGPAAELKRLYVRPGHRGRGVARSVARTLIDRARFLGYERIVLDVLPERVGAVRLWESLGFHPRPPYRSYPFPMHFLEKDLLTSP